MKILKKCLHLAFGVLTISGVLAVIGALTAWAGETLNLPEAIKIIVFGIAVVLIGAKSAEFFYEESED